MSKLSTKKRTFPGSIFRRGNKLYIKFKSRQIATGLSDTKEGWKIAEQRLRDLYHATVGITPSSGAVQSIAVQDAFKNFMREHCANKASKTKRSYSDAFHKIVTNNYYVSLERLRTDVVNFLEATTLSATSVNLHLRSFQVFLTYCYKRGYMPKLLETKEFKRREPPKPVQVYSEQEIAQLIEYFAQKDEHFALLLRFIYETGWRIGEVLNLTWDNVQETVLYRVPKDKRRLDPFPMTNTIQTIISAIPRKGDFVFHWKSTSQSALLRRLNTAMDELGIEKNGRGWHTFRKTATNRWIESGLPIQEAQVLLGHQDISTTRKHYTKTDLEQIGKKMNDLLS